MIRFLATLTRVASPRSVRLSETQPWPGLQLLGVAFCLFLFAPSLSAAEPEIYTTQVKPLLKQRCYACHGALKQEAGLRLDTAALVRQGGDSGEVIDLENPAASLLLERVAAKEIDERMPPQFEGEQLSAPQIQALRDWITAGAVGPADEQPETDPGDHWAFRPLVRPPVPTDAGEGLNPIDAFVARGHRQQKLTPQGEAPRVLLLRRLHLDLVGLPPTAAEIRVFEADASPGWYERQVDQLLDDPRHGERWARHWMDIWRYSDWWGLGAQLRNSQKHIWHWRDWLVESLNADTSYDEMVRLMLAADELQPQNPQQLRATGYLARNYFLFNRHQWMEETVEHVSKGFLGLTVNCAKCHDHKYDPISQQDFYRMRAFFEPYQVRVDLLPGEPDPTQAGVPRVFDAALDTPTYLFIRGQESNPDKAHPLSPGVPSQFALETLQITPVDLPAEAWQPARRPGMLESYLAAAQEKVEAAEAAVEQVRQKLHAAKDSQADSPAVISDAAASGTELEQAQLALAVAQAERDSIARRSAAMRADWAMTDAGDGAANAAALKQQRQEATAAAVLAERVVTLAKARQKLAEVEARRATALAELASLEEPPAPEDPAAAHVKLRQEAAVAQAAVDTAVASLQKPVEPSAMYVPLPGAVWSATRFLFSGKDDPAPPFPAQSTGRRRALAAWITDRRNPLTARVAVNHLWARHMGKPLVATVFDFGRNGAQPTHPELLDWLAVELIESGWSMKHMHRLIVGSAAYRRSSSSIDAAASQERDPDNRYWWRREPIRVESQVVRDTVLQLTGKLDLTQGGPPIPPEEQAASLRRSLYFFHSKNSRNSLLTTFDEADVTDCYRRDQSIVPQQALALTNSQLVLDAIGPIAAQLSLSGEADVPLDDDAFVERAFRVLLGVTPNDDERAASRQALDAWGKLPAPARPAREYLVWTLLNHNDFVTVR
ncbi:PSD1 and planctomycete cytochrome C domain-containing protein [Lignipirellula cremea]|uniref:Planctomycete cytochrome C n=1 Tax=Lignipirellula cremea TaxID=2528010 RepID=A0A518E1N3_9BACT|nr:PSD1 and planctomycete cytochrome C domain-containing protein [Lignipirellula cremea]QDU98007.1 Planctomycete cytochrome C [Lignipirellula cremea]